MDHENSEVRLINQTVSATLTTAEFNNRYYRGARFHLECTGKAGTSPTLDVKIQAKVGEDWQDITSVAFAQVTDDGVKNLTVYPGIAETANVSVSDVLPYRYRAVATLGGSGTPSYVVKLSASLIV